VKAVVMLRVAGVADFEDRGVLHAHRWSHSLYEKYQAEHYYRTLAPNHTHRTSYVTSKVHAASKKKR
jgi:hypothetical protein